MIVFASALFILCSWAVFSHHFMDSIVAKHLLAFAGICAALAALDPSNTDAIISAMAFTALGFGYWATKHYKELMKLIEG